MIPTQTVILFVLESLFFISILTAFLMHAAKKHRRQLVTILNHTRDSTQSEITLQKQSSQALVDELNRKIKKLKQDVRDYQSYEEKYRRIKSDYSELKEKYDRLNIDETVPESSGSKKHIIAVGSTVDDKYGVEPSYLRYLSKKQTLNDATQSIGRSTHEVSSLNKKIDEQRSIIQTLEDKLRGSARTSELSELKAEGQRDALASLHTLEESLVASQKNSQALEANLIKVKKDLTKANEKVSVMEVKFDNAKRNKDSYDGLNSDKSGLIIEHKSNEENSTKSEEQEDLSLALRDYEKIKKEVALLRNNTSQQRQLIFSLEEEIINLKADINNSSIPESEKQEREKQVNRLQQLLKETETCVDILEGEVSYLQEKITSYDNEQELNSIRELYERKNEDFTRLQKSLERAGSVRAKLREIIALALINDPKEALELVSQKIMEAFEPIGVDVHFKMITQLGEIDASNNQGFSKEQLEFLSMTTHKNPGAILEADDGFIMTQKRMGVFVKAKLTDETSLGKLQDTVSFILVISNTVVTLIDEKQANRIRLKALKRLVDGVRKKIGQLSVQARYQSDEAKSIFDGLVKELNSSLNTMNVTENQSNFFAQMIDETKQRMDLLLQSEIVVDKSFAELLSNIEKSTLYIKD